MKMRSLLFAVLAGTLILSCQKQPGAPEVRFSQEGLSLESGAVQGAVEMMANRSWTASTNAPWCRVYPNSGNGFEGAFGTIHILCEENLTPLQRSCDVTVTAGSVSRSIRITQGHREGVLIPEKEYDLGPEERTLEVKLWHTTSFTAETSGPDSDWIHIIKTKAMDEGSLTIHLSENPSIARSGIVKIKYGDREDILTIRQRCGYVKFEDKAFEKWCLSNVIDQDMDGRISADEARAYTGYLAIPSETVSVAGLEHFTNIETLHCFASLKTLDINPVLNLQNLIIESSLNNLICDRHTNIKSISLRHTALSSLYLAGCTGLNRLEIIQDTRLPEIYFGTHSSLKTLNLTNCEKLRSLNLSDLSYLSDAEIYNLPLLERIAVQRVTGLKRLVLSGLEKLKQLDGSVFLNLTSLFLCKTGIRELSLPDMPALQDLQLPSCDFDVFSIGNCPSLGYLNLNNSRLNSLDLSFCPNLTFMECNYSRLEKLDLSPCPHIMQVHAEEAALTSLTARDNRELTFLNCNHNQLEEVTITGCTALAQLALYDNQLTKLQIPDGDSLYEVSIGKNPITELDTGSWPRLYNLSCEGTQLTSLDFTQNRDLQFIYAINNPQLKVIYLIAGKDYWRIDKDPETELVYR